MSLLRFQAVKEASNRKAVPVDLPKERAEKFYAEAVFNRQKMFEYLPRETYDELVNAIDNKQPISRKLADSVAAGMKQWAIENGARHYTHWFHPLTGGTAEKHDAFIEHDGKGGVVEKFDGKLLVQQEPDASSFPNGGIRNTFEARGYSAWDISSPVFILNKTLCIPTIFISYTGESLDFKTPLLRALNAVDKAAAGVARYFDKDVKHVQSYLGWEQEYFLVDEALYAARPDLVMTGRTLMGHESAKNQQLEDHYFGAIPSRVEAFMLDLEVECHRLGIPAHTRHNEVAPNQFELAPIFEETNLANDHNLLLMSIMSEVAKRHNFRVLLHEKPFNGINGSGKHNNYSLCTDTGENLLRPGKNPESNLLFLLMLCAFIRGVDLYADLLRMSAACAGNDHRLGGGEAPPPIISIFLGNHLTAILNHIAQGSDPAKVKPEEMDIGVDEIPNVTRDETDRNRTSPFAFTGNKFEFRMVGSSQSLAYSEVVLNTILADSFEQFANQLEPLEREAVWQQVQCIIRDTMRSHGRVIYNGNNYSEQWVMEAQRRGLPILRTSVEAFATLTEQKNIELFDHHHIFSPKETAARYEIQLENYIHVLQIEASTMLEIAKRQIIPSVIGYSGKLAESLHRLEQCGLHPQRLENHLRMVSDSTESVMALTEELETALEQAQAQPQLYQCAQQMSRQVRQAMEKLREKCDALEMVVDRRDWPMPTYTDLLHRI